MPNTLNELLPGFPLLQEAFTPDELSKFLKKFRGRVDKVLRRLQDTTRSCQEIGLPMGMAKYVAKTAVQKRLDTNVIGLLKYTRAYQDMILRNREMWKDPVKHYLRHKGNSKFPRFGTLSYAFSEASIVRLVQYILRDAEEVALLKKMDREMGEKCDPVVHYEFYFTEARFSEMFQALMQDIQSTGIDPKILETLMQEVNFTKLPQLPDDEFCEARPNQLHFLYAFFHFFSLPCGDDFVREWSNEDNRPILVQEFMTSYRNDPNINPGLIHCSPASMGTRDFKKACDEFLNQEVFSPDGRSIRRGDVVKK